MKPFHPSAKINTFNIHVRLGSVPLEYKSLS